MLRYKQRKSLLPVAKLYGGNMIDPQTPESEHQAPSYPSANARLFGLGNKIRQRLAVVHRTLAPQAPDDPK